MLNKIELEWWEEPHHRLTWYAEKDGQVFEIEEYRYKNSTCFLKLKGVSEEYHVSLFNPVTKTKTKT